MLHFYTNINNIILKHNSTYGPNINIIPNNLPDSILNQFNNRYTPTIYTKDTNPTTIKQHLTLIYTDKVYDPDITTIMNTLISRHIKICLITKLHYDFDKFTKHINSNDIEAISWMEDDVKSKYYFIVV